MNKQVLRFLLAVALVQCVGCASVTITESQLTDTRSSIPTWQKSYNFYLWGLFGEHRVNVKEICRGRRAIHMQTQFTGSDVLYGMLTVGLYLPRTAKVWCEREGLI